MIGWAKYVYVCKWDICWWNFCVFSNSIRKVFPKEYNQISAKRTIKKCFVSKWRPKIEFSFREKSHVTKIWKTTLWISQRESLNKFLTPYVLSCGGLRPASTNLQCLLMFSRVAGNWVIWPEVDKRRSDERMESYADGNWWRPLSLLRLLYEYIYIFEIKFEKKYFVQKIAAKTSFVTLHNNAH